MKVWLVSSNRWDSAISEYALSAAASLVKLGHNVVFSPLFGSPAHHRGDKIGSVMAPVRAFNPVKIRTLVAIAALHRPEVAISFGGNETSLLTIVKRWFDFRLVRFWGREPRISPWRKVVSLGQMDGIVVPSPHMINPLSSMFRGTPITAVYLGIDDSKFFYDGSYRDEDVNEVTILGRLDPIKGQLSFLEVFATFLKLWPAVRKGPVLHVIGEPFNVTTKAIRERMEWCGLSQQNVRITDHRITDVRRVMNRSLLGVIPSLGSELICRVAEEFLMCGTPIFVSSAGSLKDVLFDNAGEAFDYRGSEAAEKLLHQMLRISREDVSVQALRARRARDLFCLDSMGRDLSQFLSKATGH